MISNDKPATFYSDPRTGSPRAARAPEYIDPTGRLWCVIGTAYGYLHRCDGTVRTWKTWSGATKAAKRYVAL